MHSFLTQYVQSTVEVRMKVVGATSRLITTSEYTMLSSMLSHHGLPHSKCQIGIDVNFTTVIFSVNMEFWESGSSN